MARSIKNTVDYFPHNVNHGKTMFIIENKYGNDGYAAMFKIFELLGANENHFFDCRNDENWEFMLAKTRLNDTLLKDFMNTLANCGTIHKELWEKKIVWSGNFVKNIEDVYKRRNSKCLHFDNLCEHLSIKCKHKYNEYGECVGINPQSKVEETKPKKTKVFIPPSVADVIAYFKEKGYTEESAKKAFDYYDSSDWIDSNGKQVLNWKQKMISVWFKTENKATNPEADRERRIKEAEERKREYNQVMGIKEGY